ncbi:neuromedin-U [Rhinatrema bivittatum]|uniref:neuromedin-U n=1 Tax=Rhinatrema bivittatum TaxID=194408 RepID=UPI00112B387A|nr:neuromedin-U [Rhinatrema bivittatum]
MLSLSGCRQAALFSPSSGNGLSPSSLLLSLLLLAFCTCACKGAPLLSQTLQGEQELQLWKEIDNICSAFLSTDPQSQALEELCFMVMGILQKPQGLDEKDNTKRFLFHYAKTHDSGKSDIMSSVLHPLLQLVPQLHERRMKRFKVDGELQGPGGIQTT